MTCRHCQQPIQRCPRCKRRVSGHWCKGYIHSATGMDICPGKRLGVDGTLAEPEPGQPDEVSAPVKGVA